MLQERTRLTGELHRLGASWRRCSFALQPFKSSKLTPAQPIWLIVMLGPGPVGSLPPACASAVHAVKVLRRFASLRHRIDHRRSTFYMPDAVGRSSRLHSATWLQECIDRCRASSSRDGYMQAKPVRAATKGTVGIGRYESTRSPRGTVGAGKKSKSASASLRYRCASVVVECSVPFHGCPSTASVGV